MENEKQEEVKNELPAPADETQTVENVEEFTLETEVEEETVESLKVKLAKAEEDKENYKKGMLKYKGENKEAEPKEVNADEVKTIAEQTTRKMLESSNEKTAIAQFTSEYPALKDPSAWSKVVENFNSKSGKGSVASIKRDLEAALVLAKHYGGGKIAEKEVTFNKYASVSHAGSIAPRTESKRISDSAIEMGKMFGNSAEKLEAVSAPGGNEIDLTTK